MVQTLNLKQPIDEATARREFESHRDAWELDPPMPNEFALYGHPSFYDATKAYQFQADFDEGDLRFDSRAELRYAWRYAPDEDGFRLVAQYGRFSYTLPWLTKGVQ